MNKIIAVLVLVLVLPSALATEWEPLNIKKGQTLEQHCTVISIMSGVMMKARQMGVPMQNLMETAATPLDKEILMSAFEHPKMAVAENQRAAENEFKSQWMLKCLKEHPASKKK